MKKFKKVYIEITNVCNLDCSFCPKTVRTPKFMSVNEFKHIAEMVRPYTDYIYFHVMGEPLIHPKLNEILKISSDLNFFANITTNGFLIKENEKILTASDSLHMISISLHSYEANKSSIGLESYINNISDFSKKAAENGKICSLRLWNADGNETQGQNDLNNEIYSLIQKNFSLDYAIESKIKCGSNITLSRHIYLEQAHKFNWPDINRDFRNDKIFCKGLREQFGVLCDGTVVPCCLDSNGNINLGNIFNENIYNILNSEKAIKIYNGFTGRNAVEELCQKCGYAERF